MDLTKYSAKTLIHIISTYKPDLQIQPNKLTVRKYLIHLIKTDSDLKILPKETFDLAELEFNQEYKSDLKDIQNQMIEFIKGKKDILVNEYILQPMYPNDPVSFEKFIEVSKPIDYID